MRSSKDGLPNNLGVVRVSHLLGTPLDKLPILDQLTPLGSIFGQKLEMSKLTRLN